MRKSIIVAALLFGALTSVAVTPSTAAPRKVAVRSHGQLHKPARNIEAARVRRAPTYRVYARLRPNTELGPLIASVFGLPAQYGSNVPAYRASPVRGAHRRSAASDDSSSYDSGPVVDTPSIDTSSNAAADAAASDAAIQAANDESALNASMAAAEQQNEAAQASALQTEINANNN